MTLNHLINERSPYLLQHLHNPTDWYPWSQEAFLKAQNENKPIFLSIGYSTCHWCHVMAHESFENKDIAEFLNKNFVSIKVDREERPDIDRIYMSIAIALTGQGGWPLTVFLTPIGKPFFAGTYFPVSSKWGKPGFLELLETINNAWFNQREEILNSSDQIINSLKNVRLLDTPDTNLNDDVIEHAFERLNLSFDDVYGGFSTAPKFPIGHQLSFLLRVFYRYKNQRALNMVLKTLENISRGGIYDHLAGGFHRYSTDQQWFVPHFEKMLYDQALIIRVYIEAYQITKREDLKQIAIESLDFVLNNFKHSAGGFYSAFDADSLDINSQEHKEGAFYVWEFDEIKQLLKPEEFEVFTYLYGVQKNGNVEIDHQGEFIGKNIFFRKYEINEVKSKFGMTEEILQHLLLSSKKKLLFHRSKREKPLLDTKIQTDWNGLIIGVLANASVVFNDSSYLNAALNAKDFILTNLIKDKQLFHCYCEGKVSLEGLLDDYVFFINGLIDLYEVTLDASLLAQIIELSSHLNNFKDSQTGYNLIAKTNDTLVLNPCDIYDGAIPSGNSTCLMVLIRLYYLTNNKEYCSDFESAFIRYLPTINKAPEAYSNSLIALDFYLSEIIKLSFIGNQLPNNLNEFNKTIHKDFLPHKSIIYNFNNMALRIEICQKDRCLNPVVSLIELEEALKRKGG